MNKKTFLLLITPILLTMPFNSFGQSVYNRFNCDCNNPNCNKFKLSSVGKSKVISPSINNRRSGRYVPFPGRASRGGLLQAFLGNILGQW